MMLSVRDDLLVRLAATDRLAAADLCQALVESGMSEAALVDDVLAPAMSQVGVRWEAGLWSVVDEHIATAAAETALSVTSAYLRQAPTRGSVVVACVEGDWHGLASRMVAEVLESDGWLVRFLGASQPMAAVVDYVRRHPPDAALLSCSIPMALPALLETVHAMHELSVRVFVGGGALGASARRAEAVGADGWAPHAALAGELLERPHRLAPAAPALTRLPSYRRLEARLPAWAEAANRRLTGTTAPLGSVTPADAHQETPAELGTILGIAAVATLLADETLVREHVQWLSRVHRARAVPESTIARELDAVLTTAPPRDDALLDITTTLATAQASWLADQWQASADQA